MRFSVQEYWSGLLLPSPEDLPDPGIKPASLTPVLAVRFFTTSATWEAPCGIYVGIIYLWLVFFFLIPFRFILISTGSFFYEVNNDRVPIGNSLC